MQIQTDELCGSSYSFSVLFTENQCCNNIVYPPECADNFTCLFSPFFPKFFKNNLKESSSKILCRILIVKKTKQQKKTPANIFLLNPLDSNSDFIQYRSAFNVSALLCWILQEDVDSFMKQPGNETAEAVLTKLDEQYQKYKYMELNLSQKKLR